MNREELYKWVTIYLFIYLVTSLHVPAHLVVHLCDKWLAEYKYLPVFIILLSQLNNPPTTCLWHGPISTKWR